MRGNRYSARAKLISRMALLAGMAIVAVGASANAAQARDGAETAGADKARPDQASASPDGAQGDIIVTAQRRAESLSRVPIAISAFPEAALKANKVETIIDLSALTPSFKAFTLGTGFPRFYMRGVGSNDFNIGSDLAIGVFVDDAYTGRGGTAVSDLADVQRVEVLRGPQGALFGRSTIGGAVAVTTNPPVLRNEAAIDGNFGSIGQMRGHAMVNAPLADTVALRLNATVNHAGGYITNLANGDKLGGHTDEALRAALLWQPDSRVSINLKADYAHAIGDGTVQRSENIAPFVTGLFGVQNTDAGYHQQYSDLKRGRGGQFEGRDTWGASLKVNADLDWANLTAISAWRGYKLDFSGDYDGTTLSALKVSVGGGNDQFSQEVRLASPATGRLTWIVGASFGYERVTQYSIYDLGFPILSILTFQPGGSFTAFPPGFAVTNATYARGKYTDFSVFADIGFKLTESIKALGSLRYTHDDKRFRIYTPGIAALGGIGLVFNRVDPALDRDAAFNDVSPRFTLSWQASPGTMVYATAARGYKPGGFNSTSTTGDLIRPFDKEIVWSEEGGIKSALLDNHLRLGLTAYHYTYDGLQIYSVQDQTGIIVVANGKASGRGFEGDFTAEPVPDLSLTGTIAYTDARYDRFATIRGGHLVSFAGNRAVYAPRWVWDAGATWQRTLPGLGVVSLHADYSYTGRQYFDPDNAPANTEPGHGFTNLRLGLASSDARRSLALVGRNVFDTHYRIRTNAGPEAVGFPLWLDGAPPFYGLEFGMKF